MQTAIAGADHVDLSEISTDSAELTFAARPTGQYPFGTVAPEASAKSLSPAGPKAVFLDERPCANTPR
jgi:hypothetical protein